ncbi:MAG: hypothetical protein ACREYE_19520 [Gammaproteobacteria bacterium]
MEQIKPRSTLPRGKKEGGLAVKLFKGHYTSIHTRWQAYRQRADPCKSGYRSKTNGTCSQPLRGLTSAHASLSTARPLGSLTPTVIFRFSAPASRGFIMKGRVFCHGWS